MNCSAIMQHLNIALVVTLLQTLISYCDCRHHKQLSTFEEIELINAGLDDAVKFGDEKLKSSLDKEMFEDEIEARAVMNDLMRRWTDGIVPYRISDAYTPAQKKVIGESMQELEEKTCIKFFKYDSNPPKDFIFIKKLSGCYSSIGRIGGQQELSLSEPCIHKQIIQHELLHALGVWHEQSRPDRDNYVDILEENIQEGRRHNFNKQKQAAVNSMGTPYDPDSIMHYHRTAFTKNGLNTIQWKNNPQRELGGRKMSKWDIEQLNLLYECSVIKTTKQTTTKRATKVTVNQKCNSITTVCGDHTGLCAWYAAKNGLDCSDPFQQETCPMSCGCCQHIKSQECSNFRDIGKYCSSYPCTMKIMKLKCSKTCCERDQLY